MGMCDYSIIGKKHEIDKLGNICSGVGELLKAKYGSDENDKFWDWTGISAFLLFHKPYERTIREQGVSGDDEDATAIEWIGCEPWKENEAAMWWWEIAWSHKIPTEVWHFMREESKRLGVQRLVKSLIREWSAEDDGIFDRIEVKLKDSLIKYPPYSF